MMQHDIQVRIVTQGGNKYYCGIVKFYDDDMYLFTESANIHRLTQADAFQDAQILRNDRCQS